MNSCACGAPATANGRECPPCWRARILTVHNGFTPSRTAGRGQIDPTKTRHWDGELQEYADARAEGIQPATTKRRDIDAAKAFSDEIQAPFDAAKTGKIAEAMAEEMTAQGD